MFLWMICRLNSSLLSSTYSAFLFISSNINTHKSLVNGSWDRDDLIFIPFIMLAETSNDFVNLQKLDDLVGGNGCNMKELIGPETEPDHLQNRKGAANTLCLPLLSERCHRDLLSWRNHRIIEDMQLLL